MTIGIIGTGNMGSILTTALIEGIVVPPSEIYITNRTKAKAEKIKVMYPDIHVVDTAEDVIKQSKMVFICIKPLDIYPLLEKIKPVIRPHQILISITSPIRVDQIESLVDCHVARVIPSITNRALSGAVLVTYGKSCGEEHRQKIYRAVEKIGRPICIEEDITRVASDISSCGPAFFSYLMQRFIEAAVEETEIDREDALSLMKEMIIGFGKLLEKEIFSLEGLQEKVNVKGGITGKGLAILEAEIGDVFHHVFQSTHEKFEKDHLYVDKQFDKQLKK